MGVDEEIVALVPASIIRPQDELLMGNGVGHADDFRVRIEINDASDFILDQLGVRDGSVPWLGLNDQRIGETAPPIVRPTTERQTVQHRIAGCLETIPAIAADEIDITDLHRGAMMPQIVDIIGETILNGFKIFLDGLADKVLPMGVVPINGDDVFVSSRDPLEEFALLGGVASRITGNDEDVTIRPIDLS